MIELISSEFERAGYRQVLNNLWKHEDYPDFWLITKQSGIYNLDVLQRDLFTSLADIRNKYPEIEKNTSLLILNEVKPEERDERKVIEDENDVYMFKKYVIQYTDAEWAAAKQQLPSEFEGLGMFLMQPDVFETLKNDNGDKSYFLLYTIAHKLPFVMMNAPKKDYNAEVPVEVPQELSDTYRWLSSCLDFTTEEFSDVQKAFLEDQITNLVTLSANE